MPAARQRVKVQIVTLRAYICGLRAEVSPGDSPKGEGGIRLSDRRKIAFHLGACVCVYVYQLGAAMQWRGIFLWLREKGFLSLKMCILHARDG